MRTHPGGRSFNARRAEARSRPSVGPQRPPRYPLKALDETNNFLVGHSPHLGRRRPLRARGAARRPRSSAKRDPGCPGVPVDAGLIASDAAPRSETRRPHRRRPPGERAAVRAITTVDQAARASAPARLPRVTREVASHKLTWLFRARQHRLRSHVQLPTPNQHAHAP